MNEENAFSLFISSVREDAEHVARLSADLAAQGFSFWTEQEEDHPDSSREDDALRRAIRASSAVLLVASPYSRNARPIKAALRIAQMYKRPVCPVWVQGETYKEVLPVGLEAVIDAHGEQYSDGLQALIKELRSLQSSSSAQRESASPLLVPSVQPRNPYKGLRAFQGKDARDFFGREQCIDTLAHALQEVLQAAPRQARATTRDQALSAARDASTPGLRTPAGRARARASVARRESGCRPRRARRPAARSDPPGRVRACPRRPPHGRNAAAAPVPTRRWPQGCPLRPSPRRRPAGTSTPTRCRTSRRP